MVETIFDTLNAKAALFAIDRTAFEQMRNEQIPVIDLRDDHRCKSGRTLSGQTPEAFWYSDSAHRPPDLAIGFNCALGVDDLRSLRRRTRRASPTCSDQLHIRTLACRTSSAATTRQPAHTAGVARRDGSGADFLNVVGGCCGTTAEHIAAIARRRRRASHRGRPARSDRTLLPPDAGCQDSEHHAVIDGDSLLVNVGERTNVTGSAAVRQVDPRRGRSTSSCALVVARHQVDNGAQIIDVNMDEAHARQRSRGDGASS